MTPNSRAYLNRFLSPDSIIPDLYNPLDWDRYTYVRNNPVNNTDPTGYDTCNEDNICFNRGGYYYRYSDKTREELYDLYKNNLWQPYPTDVELLDNPGGTLIEKQAVLQKTIHNYEGVRKTLFMKYGTRWIGSGGKNF